MCPAFSVTLRAGTGCHFLDGLPLGAFVAIERAVIHLVSAAVSERMKVFIHDTARLGKIQPTSALAAFAFLLDNQEAELATAEGLALLHYESPTLRPWFGWNPSSLSADFLAATASSFLENSPSL